MDRRTFLQSMTGACLAIGIIPVAGCSALPSIQAESSGNDLRIARTSLDPEVKILIVRSNRTNFPILLQQLDHSEYTAVLMECTHKNCEVRPEGSVLVCPCHGAEFAFNGKLLKAPAEKDLRKFPVRSDQSFIYIDLTG